MNDKKIRDILLHVERTPHAAFFFTPPQIKSEVQSWFFTGQYLHRIEAANSIQLEKLMNQLDHYSKNSFGYGYLTYEAGNLIAGLTENTEHSSILGNFIFTDENDCIQYDSASIMSDIVPNTEKYRIDSVSFDHSKEQYAEIISKIHTHLSLGDCYQINFTTRLHFDVIGSASEFFIALLYKQSAPYAAFINDGQNLILSLSPELFFERTNGKLRCRPMKGTEIRGKTPSIDDDLLKQLATSEKNMAENLMIVDLIRNDINSIDASTCAVTRSLFDIERYETIFQMVSEIDTDIPNHIPLSSIIKSLFPCGSITGAPKRRSMEIIAQCESSPRGIYTGCIGLFTPGCCRFSIPIRTIILNQSSGNGVMGIGGGVVWDSSPEGEYAESISKGRFLTEEARSFYLFETMLVEQCKITFLDNHLERIGNAANKLLFAIDIDTIKDSILKTIQNSKMNQKYRLRLALYKWGKYSIEMADAPSPQQNVKIILSGKRLDSNIYLRYFKTSDREEYDTERKAAEKDGFFEVIFTNNDGFITEGVITNIFIRTEDKWYTPPIESGLLNGIYRSHFITKNAVIEKPITVNDIIDADEMILTNALRKEIVVSSVTLPDGSVKDFG